MRARMSSLLVRLSFLGALVGAGLFSIGCGGVPTVPPPVKCFSDRDCPTNHRCDKSSAASNETADFAAMPAPCNTTGTDDAPANCGGGGVTPPTRDAGQCVAIPQPSGCYSDRDCKNGQYCKASTTPPRTTCTSSSDGQTKCIRAAYKGVCTDNPPTPPTPTGCKSDSDCASDESCEHKATTTRCGSATPGSTGSGGSTGAPQEDFRAPERCDAPPSTGTCVKRPKTTTCANDSDCNKDEVCQQASTGCGTVEPDPAPGTDREAMPAPNCMPTAPVGRCVKRPVPPLPPKTTCANDSDCGKADFCDFSNQTTDPDDDDDAAPTDPAPKRAPGAMPEPPQKRGVCNPRPKTRCTADSDCTKGQTCVKDSTDPEPAPDAPDVRAPCEPGTNCGGGMPAPPPSYGTCQDSKSNCTTTRRSDGATCTTCGATTTCSKGTP